MATPPHDPHATVWQPGQRPPQPVSDPDLTRMEDASSILQAAQQTQLQPPFVPPGPDPAATQAGQLVAPGRAPTNPDATTWEDAASVAAASGQGPTRVHGPRASDPTLQLDASVASGLVASQATAASPAPSRTQLVDPEATRAAPPRADAVPQQVGRYTIERALASGGMGTVYVAHDPQLDRKVALKLMRPLGDDYNRRFRVEAQATARLDHPHIVSVYDAGEVQGRPYLIMALVDGESLHDRLTRCGTFAAREVCAIGIALANALGYAHAQHVLHRDLKPENVLITAANRPLITDFGLAKLKQGGPTDLTAPGTVLGTPAFMSPEQAQGLTAQIDARTDVYSLGATLFALLTNQPPIDGPSATAVIQAVPRTPVPDPRALRADTPRALADVIMRCLAKSPDGRYPDMASLEAALKQAQRTSITPVAKVGAPAAGASASARAKAPKARKPTALARSRSGRAPAEVPDNTGKTVLLVALAVSLFAIAFVGVLIASGGDAPPPPAGAQSATPVAATPAPAQPTPAVAASPAAAESPTAAESPAQVEPPPVVLPPLLTDPLPPPPRPADGPPHPADGPLADDGWDDDWGTDEDAWGPAGDPLPRPPHPGEDGWRPPHPPPGGHPPPGEGGRFPPPREGGHAPPPDGQRPPGQ